MDFNQFKKIYQKKEVKDYPHRVSPTPLVSVMVQTYQHKDYIKDCLDSILEQETNFPFEILLGEDFSSDGTREICMEYADKYPDKVRLFLHHPDNKIEVLGIKTGNFNALYNFFSANGKFIAFCEGDDFWKDRYKLQKQIDFLKFNSAYALSFHSFREVDGEKSPIPKELNLNQPKQDIKADDLKRLEFHPLLSTVCFRNLFKEDIPEQMVKVVNVDSFLLSYLGNFGWAGFLIDIEPSLYRRHIGGIWGQKPPGKKLLVKIVTYKNLARFYKRLGEGEVAVHFTKEHKKYQKMFLSYGIKNMDLQLILGGLRKLIKH